MPDELQDDIDAPERTAVIADVSIGRHPGPISSDGEVLETISIYAYTC